MKPGGGAPAISVIVVCRNERENIAACLDSLLGQEIDAAFEVIVSDGRSTDGTLEVAREYERRHPSVRVVVEPRRGTAAGRNAGVRAARAGLIAFLDADCTAPPGWLAALRDAFRKARERDPAVAAVGGPSHIPERSTPFAEALRIALDTWLGSAGRVTGKIHARERYVEDLPSLNVMYEKRLFEEIGPFDDTLLNEGEDADFSYRILRSGRKLLYSPLPGVRHKYRPDPRSWFNNMRRYGRARARLIMRQPAMLNFQYLAPLLLTAGIILSPLGLLWRPFLLPLGYFPAVLFASCREGIRRGRPRLIPHIFAAFCLTHLGYGAGELEGVAKAVARGRGRINRRAG
ncbi:MAG: glycosyltransferase [bacterium]|nr:glycosyltransferase [bacterium]